jgi:hypothetical protein
MDSVLSSPIVMPALQQVEILMSDFYERLDADSWSKEDMIFSGYPLLSARGVLEIPAPTTHSQVCFFNPARECKFTCTNSG